MMNRTALLIIDMQHDFSVPGGACEIPGAHATIPMIRKILLQFRELNWPIFHVVREYRADGSDVEITRLPSLLANPMLVPGTPGVRIAPGLEPEEGEYRIVKQRFSAFMYTELDLMLRRLQVKRVVVTGTQLPVCLRTTLFDGLSLDYEMILLTDASSSRTPEIHQANIVDIQNIGIACYQTQDFITQHMTKK